MVVHMTANFDLVNHVNCHDSQLHTIIEVIFIIEYLLFNGTFT